MRPQIVVATKIDAFDEPEKLERLRQHVEEEGKEFRSISSVTNLGIKDLVNTIDRKLGEMKRDEAEQPVAELIAQ